MFTLQLFHTDRELNNDVTLSCRGCVDIVVRELLTTKECTMINILDDELGFPCLLESVKLHENGVDLDIIAQRMDDPDRGIIRTL